MIEDRPLKVCTGCLTCESACSFFHEKKFNYEKSRIRVFEEGYAIYRPHICRHCVDAPCVQACPTNAILRDKDGVIRIDEDKCTECGTCVEACPFDAIWLRPDIKKPITCDLCDDNPQCVKFCPEGVLHFTESKEVSR